MVLASNLWQQAQSVLGLAAVGTTPSRNLTELFGSHLSPDAVILPPTYKRFHAEIQQRWTDFNAPSFNVGAIKPATPSDIQAIVKIAAANDIPFFVTGGGHGITNYSSFDGLSIELGKFNTIKINDAQDRITIGGAVKIHQLIQPLADIGRELPLGSCACVGVVGATLGGGIGGLHGRHGPLIDQLEQVEVVTAAGDLITASEKENQDLFWALRGAGSNFGIVTSATYRLPEISNGGYYINADFVYPAERNSSFWKVMAEFDRTLPSRLAITAVAFYDRVNHRPVIAVNAVYYGRMDDALPHLKPFDSLNPVMRNISSVPADGIMDAAFFNFFGNDNGACTPNQHINIFTVALKKFDASTFEAFFSKMNDFWKEYPDYQGRLLMQRYSTEGPMRTPDEATAYPNREIKTFMNIEGFYSDPSIDDAVNKFSIEGRRHFIESSGCDKFAAYSNYARGDEGPIAWYGERKLAKLAALKRKWDPNQLFSANNPVPLHWPGEQGDL
ncbi:hypothetical protein QBC42DRAFT_320032 [Cladorrhinum samala]|uniref:FAD-binding PCMH-type domain-containing protein n=1 Tax=Cladorrhinum samala TaxID=585594 RepID=A0AAV9HUF3_9PEZI|nr:hypothetical protein QBC42DRAFT_320032 [Cladorrhinum samala]